MTDTDDRPSIAELKRDHECAVEECWTGALGRALDAHPLLLEIADTALVMRETEDFLADTENDLDQRACDALNKFHLALAKVRP